MPAGEELRKYADLSDDDKRAAWVLAQRALIAQGRMLSILGVFATHNAVGVQLFSATMGLPFYWIVPATYLMVRLASAMNDLESCLSANKDEIVHPDVRDYLTGGDTIFVPPFFWHTQEQRRNTDNYLRAHDKTSMQPCTLASISMTRSIRAALFLLNAALMAVGLYNGDAGILAVNVILAMLEPMVGMLLEKDTNEEAPTNTQYEALRA